MVSKIRSTLFPPGGEIRDTVLIQVGPELGWKPTKPESFSDGARQAAHALRKQVQRLSSDEVPAKIGGYGTFSSSGPGGRIVVHVQGALHLVDALAAHRILIDKSGLWELLTAMLDMIEEPDNLISNRASLTDSLRRFVDRFPVELERRAIDVLEPLAMGKITESSRFQSYSEARNPLNPFKMAGGDPIELRGTALMFLCRFDRDRPNVCTALHEHVLLAAITSAESEVRRYALLAAAEGGNLTPMERASISLAGLDPDHSVARLAILAMINSGGLQTLEPIAWQIILRVIESATHSSNGGFRAAAAEMLKVLPRAPSELSRRLETARQSLLTDSLFSVRKHLLDNEQ